MIEAGLGGRYDATNVIPSRVQVLTSVGLEHTRWLGPTVSHIAEEKLAVVGSNGTLVVGELPAEVLELAERTARDRGAALVQRPRPRREFRRCAPPALSSGATSPSRARRPRRSSEGR